MQTGNVSGLDERQAEAVLKATRILQRNITPSTNKKGGVIHKFEEPIQVLSQFGYIDFLELNFDAGTAVVADFKFGKNSRIPIAAANYQIQAYVLGVWDTYPEINEIKGGIIAPFMVAEEDWCDFNRKTHEADIRADINLLINAGLSPDPVNERPSAECCQYCARIHECAAVKKNIQDKLPERFKKLGLDPSEFTGLDPSKLGLDREVAGKMRKMAAVAKKWSESVLWETLNNASTKGLVPEGFDLRHKDKRLSLKLDNEGEAASLCTGLGIDYGDLTQAVSYGFSIDKLAGVLKKKNPSDKNHKARLIKFLADQGLIPSTRDTEPYLKEIKK